MVNNRTVIRWINKIIGLVVFFYGATHLYDFLVLLNRDFFRSEILSSYYFRQYYLTSWVYFSSISFGGFLLFFEKNRPLTIHLIHFSLIGLTIEFGVNLFYWQMWNETPIVLLFYVTFFIYFFKDKNIISHFLPVIFIINIVLIFIQEFVNKCILIK
jgi:hypothetical protein